MSQTTHVSFTCPFFRHSFPALTRFLLVWGGGLSAVGRAQGEGARGPSFEQASWAAPGRTRHPPNHRWALCVRSCRACKGISEIRKRLQGGIVAVAQKASLTRRVESCRMGTGGIHHINTQTHARGPPHIKTQTRADRHRCFRA
jgi:hypothetical protein